MMVKNRIRMFRNDKLDLSQGKLSEMLPGKPGKTVLSLIENGHVLPTPETMTALCSIFSCTPLDLYDESDILYSSKNNSGGDLDSVKEGHINIKSETFDALKELGYNSLQEWINESQRELLKNRDLRRASTMTFTK